jgi:hypothetical protein
MATTYVLASDVGKIRLAIGDHLILDDTGGIQPGGAHYTDEELTTFLTAAGGYWRAAVPLVLRATANRFAVLATSITLEGYSESYAGTAAQLIANAKAWEEQNDTYGDGSTFADMFGFADEAPHLFSVDQWGAIADAS